MALSMTTKYERFANLNLDVRSRSGDELIILCPFHDDTNPSLYLNSKSGLWLCHACGEGGSMEMLRVRLWGQDGPPMELDSLEDVYETIKTLEAEEVLPAQQFYPESFLRYFDFPTTYWMEDRGLSFVIIEKFGLGSDPFNDEVTIPLRDEHGNLLGVIRRKLGEVDGSRYEYPKRTKVSDLLFGSWAIEEPRAYLTEGSIDAMSLWDIGLPALATGGSRMSNEQASMVRRIGISTLIIFPDNRAVDKAADELVRSTARRLDDVMIRVVDWSEPDAQGEKDANDLAPALRAAVGESHIPLDEWLTKIER